MTGASEPVGGVRSAAATDRSTRGVDLADRPGASGPPLPGAGKEVGSASRYLRERRTIAVLFLAPALLMLTVLVVWPILNTVWLSVHDSSGTHFVGLHNYVNMFQAAETRRAIRNNIVWVVVAPTVVTVLGLIFAVLTEKIRLATAFKTILFMPMAVSFLSAGVTWRLVYDESPDRGVLNAAIVAVHDAFSPPTPYAGMRPRNATVLTGSDGGDFQTVRTTGAGSVVTLP